ncbi:MAG: hypothetical protein K1X72_21075 [Pyrinomonadaceae bacterium]|nr:hypothetical protein [Pyrinomonadaceae bacterium]
MKAIILTIVILVFCVSLFSQTPCTNEMAFQTVGKWGKPKTDDLAMADRSFPKTNYSAVLAKANKVIELFKISNPEFKGIEASAYRGIRGNSLLPNGALPFRVDVGLFEFYCVPVKGYSPAFAGKIRLGTESGTWIYFYFNSFGWVLENVESNGGESLFYAPKQLGKLRGMTLLEPSGGRLDVKQEALIITPNSRLPYQSARPKGGKSVVALDKDFFNPNLPRSAIQFITVYWGWDNKNPVTSEAIRQFKQNFDFEALKQMLGK